jgi:hypothetical protein
MRILIDIPEDWEKGIKNMYDWDIANFLYETCRNGTPIPDNATNICGDNRFEIIAKAKEDIISATNIEDAKDEMECLDSFLFRCWQMGWLDKYAPYQKGGK